MAKKHARPQSATSSNVSASAPVTVVTEKAPQLSVTLPNRSTHLLGKGLWGIVGSQSRYSTVTQFGGLEFVRYEYRRIPEQFRDAAFLSTFLDVVDIGETLESGSVEEGEIALPALEEDASSEKETPADLTPAEDEIDKG
jgi:hypothetical protein